ncbi:MAG TPA: hypothetical protein VF271_11940 [Rhodanobacteraceae bacterium]
MQPDIAWRGAGKKVRGKILRLRKALDGEFALFVQCSQYFTNAGRKTTFVKRALKSHD